MLFLFVEETGANNRPAATKTGKLYHIQRQLKLANFITYSLYQAHMMSMGQSCTHCLKWCTGKFIKYISTWARVVLIV